MVPRNTRELEQYRRQHRQAGCYASEIPGVRLLHKHRVAAVVRCLRRGAVSRRYGDRATMLEVGCGEGYLLERIHTVFPTWTMLGTDLSTFAVECARERVPSATIEVCPSGRYPAKPQEVDALVCSEVLEHVTNDREFLESMREVLNPSGFMVLTTPNLYTMQNRLRKMRGRHIAPEIPEHVREYEVGGLRELLTASGFTVETLYTVGFAVPRMHLIRKSALLTTFVFAFSHVFRHCGRIIVCRARVANDRP